MYTSHIEEKGELNGTSLNSSASHLFQTPPPFSDWLYADRLHAIDRYGVSYILLRLRNYNNNKVHMLQTNV
ncbi:hypothetical protein T02_7196 [Trichinella nativa]|uniref:Uncharacterized protein n=1 Tax=Trichinella nativa TaxID=6335 RepID=A0A0V1KYL2_9BILA|nr:hypothetical protein T02_7196 [Trichinella nativa]